MKIMNKLKNDFVLKRLIAVALFYVLKCLIIGFSLMFGFAVIVLKVLSEIKSFEEFSFLKNDLVIWLTVFGLLLIGFWIPFILSYVSIRLIEEGFRLGEWCKKENEKINLIKWLTRDVE